MRITVDMLREARACEAEVLIFADEWPSGVEVSKQALRRAVALGLNLDWAARKFLCAPLRKAYQEARAEAYKAYSEAVNAAHNVYDDAASRKAYQEARAEACKAYNEASPAAWIEVLKLM